MTGLRTMIGAGALMALGAAQASAAGTFQPPKGCEAFATVQHRNCEISHHYRCASDAAGDQWAVYADDGGPTFATRIDSETRWIQSHDLLTGETDRIGAESDPASFTELLATGRDDYAFETRSDTGEIRRFVGFDLLTGGRVTIDGVPLERTEFEITAFDTEGQMVWQRHGRQLIHRDWRLFFSDTEQFVNAYGDRDDSVSTPVTFAFPGDKGFLTGTPQFGCDMMMTTLGVAVMPAGYGRAP